MPLTDSQARNAKPKERPYKLTDGQGLFLLVRPNGSRLWRLKYRYRGKEKLLSLGPYPAIGVAAARVKRNSAKELLAEGKDPIQNKAETVREVDNSFRAIAQLWHDNRKSALDPAHALRVWSRMDRDVFPVIGHKAIQDITAPDVLDMIRKIEARGALDVSRRAKQSVGQVFQFAIACGLTSSDPTAHLKGALKPKAAPEKVLRPEPRLTKAARGKGARASVPSGSPTGPSNSVSVAKDLSGKAPDDARRMLLDGSTNERDDPHLDDPDFGEMGM